MQAMTTEPLDAKKFAILAPAIRNELLKRVRAGALTVGDSLQQVFVEFFGAGRPRSEQVRFMLFAAPMARRIAIELANAGDRIGSTEISVADLKMWLWWLDTTDPLCSRMIDLHYFAGLSFKETAAVLDLPPHAVIRDLRFAKAWLQLRLT
jgi:DNA-directed RNA polymerase specialized sigma24 family protein